MKILALTEGVSCTRLSLAHNEIQIKSCSCHTDKIHRFTINTSEVSMPEAIVLGDTGGVLKTDFTACRDIDLMIVFTPCDGGKSVLSQEVIRIHEECRPRYLLLEDVKEILR